MGYSIMTEFDKKTHKKMLAFLDLNFNEWGKLTGDEFTYRGPTDDVSYGGKSKYVIGFDYSSWAGQHVDTAYCFRICYWMAKMTGNDSVLYDGCERWELEKLRVDEIGFKKLMVPEFGWILSSKEQYKYNLIIKKELERLTTQWLKNYSK